MDTKNINEAERIIDKEEAKEIEAKEVKKSTLQKIDDFKKDHPVVVGLVKTTVTLAIGIGIGLLINNRSNDYETYDDTIDDIVLDDIDVIVE